MSWSSLCVCHFALFFSVSVSAFVALLRSFFHLFWLCCYFFYYYYFCCYIFFNAFCFMFSSIYSRIFFIFIEALISPLIVVGIDALLWSNHRKCICYAFGFSSDKSFEYFVCLFTKSLHKIRKNYNMLLPIHDTHRQIKTMITTQIIIFPNYIVRVVNECK